MDFKHIHFESLDSTNDKAKSMVQTEPCPFVISANTQTKGKGQRGKSFHSPKDKGLYFSCVVDVPLKIKELQTLNLTIGEIVSKTVNELYNIQSHSVYPNDVYVKDQKLAGILTEGIYNTQKGFYDFVIIGVGLNVLKDHHKPPFIQDIAISLEDITHQQIDQNILLNHLVINILKSIQRISYEQ